MDSSYLVAFKVYPPEWPEGSPMQAAQGCQMHPYAAPSQHFMVNQNCLLDVYDVSGITLRPRPWRIMHLRAGIVSDIILISALADASQALGHVTEAHSLTERG